MSKLIDFLARPEIEGIRTKAYLCQAGKPTIGIGCTFYEDGKPVRLGDVITKERAFQLAEMIAPQFSATVKKLVKSKLTENQFIVLCSFAFQEGNAAFASSTLLKKVNANPNDPTIRDEFMKWVYAKNPKTGKKEKSAGIIKRRTIEADLYFTV